MTASARSRSSPAPGCSTRTPRGLAEPALTALGVGVDLLPPLRTAGSPWGRHPPGAGLDGRRRAHRGRPRPPGRLGRRRRGRSSTALRLDGHRRGAGADARRSRSTARARGRLAAAGVNVVRHLLPGRFACWPAPGPGCCCAGCCSWSASTTRRPGPARRGGDGPVRPAPTRPWSSAARTTPRRADRARGRRRRVSPAAALRGHPRATAPTCSPRWSH